MSFLVYKQKNVKRSEDFEGLDSASVKISKETFLRLLSSGRYLPLRLISPDSTARYKLFNLNPSTDKDIRETIKNWAAEEYEHYKMEGKEFPDFDFVDLNGNIYNKGNSKGKIVVLKC